MTAKQEILTVFFLHIPKAAGSTLGYVLRANYPKHEFVWLSPNYRNHAAELEKALAVVGGKPRLVAGHFKYGVHRMLDLADAPYFTFLRRPYARLRSYYWYIRSNPNHYYHDALLRSGDSFAEFLRNPASPEVRNQQTRLIAGCNTAADQVDEREFAMAKDRMAAKFLAVGLQERFDESLVVLKLVLGLKDIDYVSLNRGSKSASVEEPAAAEVIRETNTYDQRLYGFAEELLDEQIARFGDRFHEELGGLHERQRSLTHRIKEELERAKQTAKYLGGRWKRKALQITQATGH